MPEHRPLPLWAGRAAISGRAFAPGFAVLLVGSVVALAFTKGISTALRITVAATYVLQP